MRITIILLFFVAVFSPGCKKHLLETSPFYDISTTTAWTTDELTDQGVTGVYAALRQSNVIGGNGMNYGSLLSPGLYAMDIFGLATQSPGGYNDLNDGSANTTTHLFTDTWSQLYEGISRANDAIAQIPEKSPSDPRKKARYIAECKFLRAYFYYRLNQVFQGVPVYLEPKAFDQFIQPRSSADSVWNVIIRDLSEAITEDALPLFYPAGNENYGHITKGAAYALRGKAYMYQKKWDQAIADFEQVKTAGYHIFTGAGTDSYKMLFKEANEQCPEMIFSMQNIDQPGYGGDISYYCGPVDTWGDGIGLYNASPDLVDLYENKDGSPFNWDKVIPGYSQMQPAAREVYFMRDGATPDELQAAAARGADLSQYLPEGNEERVLKAYSNRDPRLKQTIITPYATYLGRPAGALQDFTYTFRWPFRNDQPPIGDLQANVYGQDYCFYGYRKFVFEGSTESGHSDQSPIDFPIIRYAEVALLYAEALSEKEGVSQEAIDWVNEVRDRAGAAPLQMINATLPTFVSSPDDLRSRIRNEFRVEFPNEGICYFNELRWHTLKEIKFGSQNGIKQIWGSILTPYIWMGDMLYSWPIPLSVVQSNQNMEKTPGWIY
ncbi:MAG: RagB/SusD family nutrient uptake outer membrane protein [Chitinophagaceae bacterium]|nr:RagB/SusD family nutrient uptake outer membrane protein [Chitinophagaceae bacterium]